jgi:non-ribosomal peptide synthetase component F
METHTYYEDGTEPHYEACERLDGDCMCERLEASADAVGFGIALDAHRGHKVVVDSPMDSQDDAEDVAWCDKCCVTVWYLESDMSPDA